MCNFEVQSAFINLKINSMRNSDYLDNKLSRISATLMLPSLLFFTSVFTDQVFHFTNLLNELFVSLDAKSSLLTISLILILPLIVLLLNVKRVLQIVFETTSKFLTAHVTVEKNLVAFLFIAFSFSVLCILTLYRIVYIIVENYIVLPSHYI